MPDPRARMTGMGQSVASLERGDRVTDLTDWTHATVLYGGEYDKKLRSGLERCVSLHYDDGRMRDFIPIWRLIR